MNVLNWIDTNKEWFLDGVGGTAILAVIGFVLSKIFKKDDTNSNSQNATNNISNGDNGNSVIGNGNQISITNNYLSKDSINEENEQSDFSKRYFGPVSRFSTN